MIGFIVDVEFEWGYQCKVAGLTRGSAPYLYPPLTTFLGALSESIAKLEKIGENKGREIINKLAENLLAIGFRPMNCVPIKFQDINRIVSVKLTSGVLYPDPQEHSFDAPAMGRTMLISFNDEAPKIRWFIIFNNETISLESVEINLEEKYFWKIHRIGSKESRVCVINIIKLNENEINKRYGTVITNYTFPIDENIRIEEEKVPKWETECYIDPFDSKVYLDFSILNKLYDIKTSTCNLRVFKVPVLSSIDNFPEYIVKLNEKYVLYEYKNEKIIGIK